MPTKPVPAGERDAANPAGFLPDRLRRARLVAEKLRLSARGWHRMLRVARSIADLEAAIADVQTAIEDMEAGQQAPHHYEQ